MDLIYALHVHTILLVYLFFSSMTILENLL